VERMVTPWPVRLLLVVVGVAEAHLGGDGDGGGSSHGQGGAGGLSMPARRMITWQIEGVCGVGRSHFMPAAKDTPRSRLGRDQHTRSTQGNTTVLGASKWLNESTPAYPSSSGGKSRGCCVWPSLTAMMKQRADECAGAVPLFSVLFCILFWVVFTVCVH